MEFHHTTDAEEAWTAAQHFLERYPVLNSVPITLLHQRLADDKPGRYWWVTDDEAVVAFLPQTPLDRAPYLAGNTRVAVTTLATVIADSGVELPGVTGEAGAASAFAGQWAESTGRPVRPNEVQAIYTLDCLVPLKHPPSGFSRPATQNDAPTLVKWIDDMAVETGGYRSADREEAIAKSIEDGGWHIWDDGGAVSVAHAYRAVTPYARVGPVYTPKDRRGHGYAAAATASASAGIEAEGAQAMLFTQLSNPTSNSIYRRLGYRQVAEVLAYDFDGPEASVGSDST